jgi:hypothetical protein
MHSIAKKIAVLKLIYRYLCDKDSLRPILFTYVIFFESNVNKWYQIIRANDIKDMPELSLE